ncbi:Gfo/Idh/MocA family protein [Coraliomargarita parva]|uniref:Gfo/Idh/MocA family protein n=1 Tax=Coraliomargarita parva TaxID=3014050 RepID=UPI0022B4C868|nr:Gfo/Idh/MocA family oxidoreductase [Coraliomargarita parva]
MPRKLKLIQCGVGGFGRSWLDVCSASEDFELAALVDINQAALSEAGQSIGLGSVCLFDQLSSALDAVEAEAILTITPPEVHIEHAREAFARGLHVMTEKPVAESLDEARTMIQLAQEAKRQLMVSQQYRFNAPILQMKEALGGGEIGTLTHGHIDFYVPGDFRGSFRESMPYPLLHDMAIHHVDLIRALTQQDIRQVTARAFRTPSDWFQNEAGLKMLLELENGLLISYSGDWSALGRFTGWNGNWRLQGTQASLHLDNDVVSIDHCEAWMKHPSHKECPPPASGPVEREATLQNFARSIRSGIPAETSGEDNIKSLAVIMAAIKSNEELRPVTVSELL